MTTYDADGNVASRTDGTGHTTGYTYGADGELTETSVPNGNDVSQTWTGDGLLASLSQGAGHTTSYGYDARGLRVSSTDGLGQITSYSYDGDGNLVLQAAPGATCTGSSPSAGCTSFVYDADSNVTTTTWPSVTGEVDQAGYNDADAPTLIQDLQGSTVLAGFTYGYNGNNQLVYRHERDQRPDPGVRLQLGAGADPVRAGS